MRKTKKMLFLSFSIILAVSLIVGGATFAIFTSQANVTSNNFDTGKLEMIQGRLDIPMVGPMFYTKTSGGPGTDGKGTMPTGLWAPGDINTRGMIISNNGTLDARLKSISAVEENTTDSASYREFENNAYVVVWQVKFYDPADDYSNWYDYNSDDINDVVESINNNYLNWARRASNPDPNVYLQRSFDSYYYDMMIEDLLQIVKTRTGSDAWRVEVDCVYDGLLAGLVSNPVDVSSHGIVTHPTNETRNLQTVLLAFTVNFDSNAVGPQGVDPRFSFVTNWVQTKNN